MSIILCIFTEGCLVVGLTEGEMFSPHSFCWQFYRWANRPRDQHSPAEFFHLFFQRNFNLNKTHSNLLHTIQTHKKASGDKIEQVTAKIQKSWRTMVCEIWVQSKSTYNTMLLEADFLANLSKYSYLVISLCFCPEVPYNK